MAGTWKENLSKQVLALKSGFGELLELVDNWLFALAGEEEKVRRLRSLAEVLRAPDSGLTPQARKACDALLLDLLAVKENGPVTSSAYRTSLQKNFRQGIEQINGQVDTLLAHIGKLFSSDDQQGSPAGFILAQEEERKRIAREIHDGPAQSLASLIMRIDLCQENMTKPDLLKAELTDLKESIIRTLRDIRRFIFDLRPMALDDLGLIPTLEQFIAGFRTRSGIKVSIHVEGERASLAPECELGVFRVIQEAVNNAHHHAQAHNVYVFLTYDLETKTLFGVIKDDGMGFNVEQIRKTYATLKKLGLISMEERIRLANGTFEIVSAAEEGTVVSFNVPL